MRLKKEIFSSLILILLTIANPTFGETDTDRSNSLEKKCNQDITEDQVVDVGEECRFTVNCKKSNEASECVYKSENYCTCEIFDIMDRLGEMELRKPKRPWCKDIEGCSCAQRKRKDGKTGCPRKYRRRKLHCKNRKHVCCTKCKNFKGYECMKKNSCDGETKFAYCKEKGNVCCACGKKNLGDMCSEQCPCTAPDTYCKKQTSKCECEPPLVPNSNSSMCEKPWSTPYFKIAKSVAQGAAVGTSLQDSTVASIQECHDSCLKKANCLIFIFTPTTSACSEYDYIPKRDLRQPPSSVIYKKNKLHSAEEVINNLYWYDTPATPSVAGSSCGKKGGTLVMPKSEDAYWLASYKSDKSKRYWVGIKDVVNKVFKYVDGEVVGANGYNPPFEPDKDIIQSQVDFMLYNSKAGWQLADVANTNSNPYICDLS